MKYRPQRGSLCDSMCECADVEPTRKALAKFLGCKETALHVDSYGYDSRIGWETYIVVVHGHAVGFTDSPLETK